MHVVTQDQLLFGSKPDPCERKHGGNENSTAAHESMSETKDQRYREIIGLLASAGAEGMTAKEIARSLDVQLNTVSGRFTELLASGRIVRLAAKREGSGVLVLARHKPLEVQS